MNPKKTYSEKLRDPRWQKMRLEVLEAKGWICEKCRDTTTEFHIHHIEYSSTGNPWDADPELLCVLCKHCHSVIEDLKGIFLYDDVEIVKFTSADSPLRTMIIGAKRNFCIWIYDKADQQVSSFNAFHADLPSIISMMQNCFDYKEIKPLTVKNSEGDLTF